MRLSEVPDEHLLRAEASVNVVVRFEVDRPSLAVDPEAHYWLDRDAADHPVFESPFAEHACRAGVDNSCPLALLDVLSAALFQDDALDPAAQKEVAERKPGDSCSHDHDGGALVLGGCWQGRAG